MGVRRSTPRAHSQYQPEPTRNCKVLQVEIVRHRLHKVRLLQKVLRFEKLLRIRKSKDRTRTGHTLDRLIQNNIIRRYGKEGTFDPRDTTDVIADYLTQVFLHTKHQLKILHDYTETWPVQFVLTVPVIWSGQSSRILQKCMERAIRASGFGKLNKHECIDNLIIILEPEAAVTYFMAKTKYMLVISTPSSQHLFK